MAELKTVPTKASVAKFVAAVEESDLDEGGEEITSTPTPAPTPEPAIEAQSHLMIENPFRGGGMTRLFATHPPTEERIARLQEMARRG